jgi:hypothetical protein
MHTPFFPAWRPRLAPQRSCLRQTADPFTRATLCQVEQTLGPALPPGLLEKPPRGPHSRRRVFCLTRTFWGWVWQIFQGNTSCREVLRQLQALLALLAEPPIDEDCSAYCQARQKLPTHRLEAIFQASFQSAEDKAPPPTLLQGRPVKVVDASTVRLEDIRIRTSLRRWPRPSARGRRLGCCPRHEETTGVRGSVYRSRENPLERPGLAQKTGRQPQQWSRNGFR